MGRELTASRIFSSIALFEALRDQFHICERSLVGEGLF